MQKELLTRECGEAVRPGSWTSHQASVFPRETGTEWVRSLAVNHRAQRIPSLVLRLELGWQWQRPLGMC